MAALFDTNARPWEQTATHALRFLVVGGSLAGLACAYALQKGGHHVELFERSDGEFRSPRAVLCPPPQTRLLQRWGVKPETWEQIGGVMLSLPVVEGTTGRLFHDFQFNVMKEQLDADYVFFTHGDLYQVLRDMAVAAGAVLHFNVAVTGVDPQRPAVHLADGTTIAGDIVIGADGPSSLVREVVTEEEPLEVKRASRVSFCMQIPEEDVQADPELAELVPRNQYKIWTADGQCVFAHYMPWRREYAVIILAPMQDDWVFESRWDTTYPLKDFTIPLDNFQPAIRRLVERASHATPVSYVTHEPIDDWVHHEGKVVLVGDAAFPSPGYVSNGAAAALEDADMLGTLFARLRTPGQTKGLLVGYEEVRPRRAADLAKYSIGLLDVWCTRDAGWSEDTRVETQWEDFIRVCGYRCFEGLAYDAHEVACEWVTRWNVVSDSDSPSTSSLPVEVRRDEKVAET